MLVNNTYITKCCVFNADKISTKNKMHNNAANEIAKKLIGQKC